MLRNRIRIALAALLTACGTGAVLLLTPGVGDRAPMRSAPARATMARTVTTDNQPAPRAPSPIADGEGDEAELSRLVRLAPSARRTALVAAALERWAQRDLEAAWAWTSANRARDDLALLAVAAAAIARRDDSRALHLALDCADAADRETALLAVFDVVSKRRGFDRALTIAQDIGDPLLGLQLQHHVASAWWTLDPDAAAEWIQNAAAGPSRDRLLVELGQHLLAIDPERAAASLLGVREEPLRRAALTETLLEWFDQHPADASRWIGRLPPHTDLDPVASRIATLPALVATRVDVALEWAESIVNDDLRLRSLQTIVGLWFERDPGAALRYAREAAGFTAAQRAYLKSATTSPRG